MDNLYRQAVDLQNKFRNYIDQPNSPIGRILNSEFQRLEDDVQTKKNKGSLEARVNGIIRILNDADGAGVISDNHVDDLKDRCESMRDQIRKM